MKHKETKTEKTLKENVQKHKYTNKRDVATHVSFQPTWLILITNTNSCKHIHPIVKILPAKVF